nr:hypothetical protein [Tanacetum cinerariifolium]
MAISVISVSSDSFEDSMGTPAGRVILFSSIPTIIPDTTPVITLPTTQTDTTVIPTETPIIEPTIPPSPDYTPASPNYSPASKTESDPSEDPSSDLIPPLPATSPFLSSADDTTDSDTPDTPPSPTHDYFSLDDSAQDSFLDSSSKASSDFHSDASSDSSSRHSLSDHSSPDLPSNSARPSRKRRSLRDDVIVKGSDEPHLEQDIDPEIQAEIDECIAYTDALRDRGIDARVQLRRLIERREIRAIPVHRIQVIKGVQRKQERRNIEVESAVTALIVRVAELERDNRRIKGTASVESQREMPNTQSGASMTHEEIEDLVTRRVAEEIEARKAAMNLEPLNENGDE